MPSTVECPPWLQDQRARHAFQKQLDNQHADVWRRASTARLRSADTSPIFAALPFSPD